MLDLDTVERHLGAAREVGKSCRLIDVHAHPFEIFAHPPPYEPDPLRGGVFRIRSGPCYPSPAAAPVSTDAGDPRTQGVAFHSAWAARMLGQKYRHVGAPVFTDQMDLCGVRSAVLHPVLPPDTDGDGPMALLQKTYGGCDRLTRSYCVPGTVSEDKIPAAVARAAAEHSVRAVKLHANRTGIDLGARRGVARVERMLEACDRLNLPILVHGGRSLLLQQAGTAEYATIDKLATIDWGLSRAPVILAHAGAYDYSPGEAEAVVLPAAEKLLARHSNLFVDTSGLEFDVIRAVLRRLDPDRILFGSDALYASVWGRVAILMHALESLGQDAQRALARIAGTNAERVFADERGAGS